MSDGNIHSRILVTCQEGFPIEKTAGYLVIPCFQIVRSSGDFRYPSVAHNLYDGNNAFQDTAGLKTSSAVFLSTLNMRFYFLPPKYSLLLGIQTLDR